MKHYTYEVLRGDVWVRHTENSWDYLRVGLWVAEFLAECAKVGNFPHVRMVELAPHEVPTNQRHMIS